MQNHDDRTILTLARSLPLLQRHKDELLEGLEACLRGSEEPDDAFGQAEVTAMLLTQLLIDEAASLVRSGSFSTLDGVADQHRALDIDGRHYSRFGDALAPVLKDVLGTNIPADVPSAWCDTFWRVIRVAQEQRERVPA